MRAGEKTKKLFFWGACLLAGFVVFTLLLTVMDKRPVGPEGSYVGFATINDWFHRLTGVHRFWYTFTKILGYLAILTAAGFAALTGVQFVRRGMDLRKVDQKLLLLMALYAATFVCYVLFEIVAEADPLRREDRYVRATRVHGPRPAHLRLALADGRARRDPAFRRPAVLLLRAP